MTPTFDTVALDRLAADYWDAQLELSPLFATTLGDRRFDALVPPVRDEDLARGRARVTEILERLDGLGDAPPGPAAVTASELREAIRNELSVIDSGLHRWSVDPSDGIPTQYLDVPSFQSVRTVADGEAMIARWHAMAAGTRAYAGNLRESLADGLVACSAPVARTVDILDGVLAMPDDEWPLLTPIAASDETARWTSADRDRFAAGLRAAVADDVRPAFATLRDVLAEEILPAARPPERPGIAYLPDGDAAYRAMIRVHTSLDLEPADVHALGLAEIERIDAELIALTGRVLGTRTLADGIAHLRDDPALRFTTEDEVYDFAVDALARANEAVPGWFGRLPRARCEVVRMPAHEQQHSTIAFYRQPAMDGSRPGQYSVNTYAPDTRPRYEAAVLAFHESVPGHHLQIAIGQELEGIPDFRRNLGTTAFFEGWGLYTERLADDMGLYAGDLDRIGVLSFDAWRASRLVVDTGMHALGWTRDQAVAFMLAHTALAPNNIANEVDRYIAWPGQALAYKIGQLELLRLRDEARTALGAAFDIRAFHDAVLGNGALALPTLRSVVTAWAHRDRTGAPA
jgi:uncharacterized protein (DUF885 family)